MPPRLSIIIVSYKCASLLRACLRTVREGAAPCPADVIVVDNHSGDDTVDMVRTEFPWVDLVASPRNLGFAAGNNLGLARAAGDVVVFLNPDTECAPGALATAAAVLDDATIGMSAPMLRNPDGSLQPSVRRLPTLGVSLLVVMKLHRLCRWLPAVRRYDCAGFDYESAQDVEQPMGACLLVPRRVIDRVGGFDERFWMWFEEVDLCRRVREAGYRIRYVPDARVVHALGVSSIQLHNVFRQARYADSLVRYFAKHDGRVSALLLRAASLVGLGLSWVVQALLRLRDRSASRYRLGAEETR